MTLQVIGTGGWGEKSSETETYHSLEQLQKNAASPSRLVHITLVLVQDAVLGNL